ncbi:glycerophosphodiester phosphodiesterase family protein [Emticicia sp. BO119]|uniref:glycerophosphodiester phosphodiesterase n=1 Tax=Emticicia sp. BO119 TaxID=2757768 RepID=UPI0015EFDCFC|nr:glycerophosphodiester phosphodiesterase family protein [Emticicia sp. BO119]MBA4848921.1 glycerophosphodiester phosphodiesterase family protein [Emticicia sp. BO119]
MKSLTFLLLISITIYASAFIPNHTLNKSKQTGADSLKSLKEKYNLSISAHRGSSIIAPENTLATFKTVLAMGVDYIEIDVRTTKDGQLAILHDGSLNRTTNGEGPMKNFTLAELKELSAGKGHHEKFIAERIPTLQETTRLVAEWNKTHKHQTNLYVDCKDVAPEPLVRELKADKLLKNAVFYGSDNFLLALKKVYPKAKLMPSLNKPQEIEDKVERLKPYAFDVRWTILNKELVTEIHKHNIKVFSDVLGLLDMPANYKKAAEMGVDLIQTDHVRKVYQTLLEGN